MPNDQPKLANSDDPEAVVRDLLSRASENLEPISPERALELYLEDKARDCRQSTVDSHRSRLGFLVRWCEDQGIENLNDLTARDLHEYRVWRREDLNVVSEKAQMDTVRVFVSGASASTRSRAACATRSGPRPSRTVATPGRRHCSPAKPGRPSTA